MDFTSKLDRSHLRAKQNLWLQYFTVFNRIALAAGFLPSGFVKIMGERFTDLHVKQPMGHYLEALSYTGYYYTSIGIFQMTAAILLLIPRTATLGAMMYFPIILNICLLSLAVGFEGSLLTSPLMVLANLYLLCWDYDKFKYALPLAKPVAPLQPRVVNKQFPIVFFAGSFAAVATVVILTLTCYTIMPRNTFKDCMDGDTSPARVEFCNCIHNEGKTYDYCSDQYKNAIKREQK